MGLESLRGSDTPPELFRLIRRLTFVLLALAAAVTEVAAVADRPVSASLGLAACWVSVAACLAFFVRRWATASPRLPRVAVLLLLALVAAPFIVEPWRRRWTGDGYPLELQMVSAFRNLGLGLAALAAWPLCLRLACVVSLFLILFSVCLTEHPAVLTLLALYSATGSVWLMAVYWTGLRRFFIAPETVVAVQVQPRTARIPVPVLVGVVAIVVCTMGLVAAGPQRAVRVLGEWLPTSGGAGDHDPFARGGLNDGADEVKGQNARSTGMVPSDSFLDSPLPSLYDMFNDMYGEPFKPKERERAIALTGQAKVTESKKPPADNLRANRDFPTTRRSPSRPRDPSGRSARALFEVRGRTPVHVRVATYGVFDGATWQELLPGLHSCGISKEKNGFWMTIDEKRAGGTDFHSVLPIFAETEFHQFKIEGPLGTLVPTPTNLVGFRLGRVDQPTFFRWGSDAILRFANRQTPTGIAVETECDTVDPGLLDRVPFPLGASAPRNEYRDLPLKMNPAVSALARTWAQNDSAGWHQLAAVLARLRQEYTLDPAARPPADCTDPLSDFLLRSHRGPDYEFATAAAVLLRSLGYSTRLVTGFYVAPDHYDPLSQHTPVVQEDLHFWTEVLLPGGQWLVIEPTPGYDVLGPNLSFGQRCWAILVAAGSWCSQHWMRLGLGLAVLGALWWRRRELFDAAAMAWWRWFPGSTWQQAVRRALWVMEWRGRCAQRPRLRWQTAPHWLRAALPRSSAASHQVEQLTRMVEWAAYAPDLDPPWTTSSAHTVCRRVLDGCNLRSWHSARP